jgi:leucyl-tRNA synthetase
MKRYNPKEVESKWQKAWAEKGIYKTDTARADKKFYVIPMFPYPSGDLHVGHWYNFAPTDTVARRRRMQGHNVLHCIGFDAFGLPAENAAIKRNIPPAEWTRANIVSMTGQIKAMGPSYDWEKQVLTCDPDYYKWTQWLFVKLYEKGLAYKKKGIVNWCPNDQTVLANEQVVGEDNVCERCGTPVIQKELEQWYFKILDYADRLLKDAKNIDWPERVKTMQENWIGRSQGAEIDFKIHGHDDSVRVFTTRPDTIYGATYMVLAPEHQAVNKITTESHKQEVENYQAETAQKTELDRKEGEKEKTGVFTGAYAINPANDERIPIWIADYVLMNYGTGAIMAVPAHDERDFEFAKKFDLHIREVIEAKTFDDENPPKQGKKNTKRNVVICLIRNKKDKYLTLKWNKLPWQTFVMGGVEKDEDTIDAARREIEEETGYVDLDYIGRMPFALNSIFYAAHKDVNRDIRVDVLQFELKSDKKGSKNLDSHEDFKPVWVSESDLAKIGPVGGLNYITQWVQEGDYVYTGEGRVIQSGPYSGLGSEEMREKIVADLAKDKKASEKINYKIHDWLISRQRYWGTPIPVVYCDDCGMQAIPEDQLPVVLPEDVEFTPTGQSPLTKRDDFVNTMCPKCKGPAKRETDTMDTFVDSSWYFLRYPDPNYNQGPFNPEVLTKWGPLDHYIGGIEHAILHLMYARFITKFLYDYHGLAFDEPFKKLSNQGIILGPDGNKMSKSKGNVVSPDEQVGSYGADSLRLYLMFMGPYEQGGPYSFGGIAGVRRFLDRFWTLTQEYLAITSAQQLAEEDGENTEIQPLIHQTIKKVSQDLDNMAFNTAISTLMEAVNSLYKIKAQAGFKAQSNWQYALKTLTQLLAPLAPHIAEELWQQLGQKDSVHTSKWPEWDESILMTDKASIVVQVNGKVRGSVEVKADNTEDQVVNSAKIEANVAKHLDGKTIKKAVYVPGKLVNFVV